MIYCWHLCYFFLCALAFFVSCLGTPSRCLYILVFCQTGACDLRVLPPVRQSHCFIFCHTSLLDLVES